MISSLFLLACVMVWLLFNVLLALWSSVSLTDSFTKNEPKL